MEAPHKTRLGTSSLGSSSLSGTKSPQWQFLSSIGPNIKRTTLTGARKSSTLSIRCGSIQKAGRETLAWWASSWWLCSGLIKNTGRGCLWRSARILLNGLYQCARTTLASQRSISCLTVWTSFTTSSRRSFAKTSMSSSLLTTDKKKKTSSSRWKS